MKPCLRFSVFSFLSLNLANASTLENVRIKGLDKIVNQLGPFGLLKTIKETDTEMFLKRKQI